MKKYIERWKDLNKNGLKLSMICGLNWLLKFLFKGQFCVYTVLFWGMLTYYIPKDTRVSVVIILNFLFVITCLVSFGYGFIQRNLEKVKKTFFLGVMYLFFLEGNNYISQFDLTELLVERLFFFWLISLCLVVFVVFIQPMLFKAYLFKNVINKEYLGIRKVTDTLPPKNNFYKDAEEKDVNKRMQNINQNAIKPLYQGIVEMSFLRKEVMTGLVHKVNVCGGKEEHIFEDVDTIYYPTFIVYPFGRLRMKLDLCHHLIGFKLSKRHAFYKFSFRHKKNIPNKEKN